MAKLFLEFGGLFKINVIEVGLHLVDLTLGNAYRLPILGREAQFHFCFGERYPQSPPGTDAPLRTPQLQHSWAGVAIQEGIIPLRVWIHELESKRSLYC